MLLVDGVEARGAAQGVGLAGQAAHGVFGIKPWEALILENLGHTHRALGQIAEARHAWTHAPHLYRTWHHTIQAKRLHRRLNTLDDVSRA